MADRFYIGQIDGQGLQTNLKPYAIPDNAFARLNNAYVFRGRVRKRFGGQLMEGTDATIPGLEQIQSRLKINIGTTDGSGNLGATIVPGSYFAIGQAFSVGDQFFTVYQTGTPAAMYATGAGTGTYNTTTGAVTISGSNANTTVYFYPAQPVMGLITYQQFLTNVEYVIAFDQQFAYQFGANGWSRLGTAVWTGDNSNFFWGSNSRGSSAADINLFVTNYNFGTSSADSDPMRYWDGAAWNNFTPVFSSGTPTNLILTSRIIITFKNRLLLLNVVENTGGGAGTNAVYANRCRFSWLGDPTNAAAFYDDAPGGGGYIDAPVKEAIITAQFLKDRLIVFFESSTWELAYTGNQALPFVWQQINTELGAESTFSEVPFDKVVLGVGNVGIHACNGSNVTRIDDKIPDSVFEIHNDNNGVERVCGIRDYYTEMVYWSFPDQYADTDFPFNNRVLVYNYQNGTWAFNDDSITAFGYFQTTVGALSSSPTWGEVFTTWEESVFPWGSATLQAKFRNVIAGNQQGYVFIVNPDVAVNAPSLQITDFLSPGSNTAVISSVNHNIKVGQWIEIDNCIGLTGINGKIFKVIDATANTFIIDLRDQTVSGSYLGGGTITRVTPIDILTKQYNFYANSGRNAYVSRIDFLIDRTTSGQCTVDYLISSSNYGILDQSNLTGANLGNNILETSPYSLIPYEQQQDRLWHPVFTFADGQYIQLRLFLSDAQIYTPEISNSDFQLHAMIIEAKPTASWLL